MTTELDTSTTLGEWVRRCPCMGQCLRALGIDHTTEQARALSDVCREHSLPPDQVFDCITRMASAADRASRVCPTAGVSELAEQIVATHHEYVRWQLPWVKLLLTKAMHDEPGRSGELRTVQASLDALETELREHMIRQEQATFPRLRSLEAAHGIRFVGEIDQAAQETSARYERVAARLSELSEATHGFRAPTDSSAAYRGLTAALGELSTNLEQHFRIEIDILFPRAIAIEARMRASRR